MWLGPLVPLCVLLVGDSVPGNSGNVWLVDIVVLPMGLQTTSAPSVLPLTPPLESPFSAHGWQQASVYICISKAVDEPLSE